MADRPTTPAQSRQQSTVVKSFLVLYNSVSAILWAAVLGRVVLLYALRGQWKVFFGVGEFVKWTQTLAWAEVMFSLTGLVRAPLFTTAMQVVSRLFLVWGVIEPFQADTVFSVGYSTMLLAWSITEVIRYTFFAINIGTGEVPGWLLWLRYNTFFVLYPIGISSECWMIILSIGPAYAANPLVAYVLLAVLIIYVPGSYILYTHMMKQRSKVFKGRAPAKTQ
ncbi:hypothetical protein KVT40_001182 [Elsinoe batatas]|uniref:Very-long-chain (3R)-3-hydroxyacyl-CoA dehydratase n=1 Tax=Elsinoe batatas TaxID=2601811 RepID=A0A8K0PKZ8_9PEZI|nr:hypothetical protein KVT40_001182 [Elsinoe batatas]